MSGRLLQNDQLERDKVDFPKEEEWIILISITIVLVSNFHYVSNILLHHFVKLCIGGRICVCHDQNLRR